MVTQAAVVLITRRIARAIRAYAASEGFSPGDYAVVGTFDAGSERLRLSIGSDRPMDRSRWFRGILDAIDSAFPDDPYVSQHVGIVIRQVARLDDVYWDAAIGEGEVDITDLLERTSA